jgi:hypothetical protein
VTPALSAVVVLVTATHARVRKQEQHGATVDVLNRTPNGRRHAPATDDFTGDIVDEWGRQSFPASDPPANW